MSDAKANSYAYEGAERPGTSANPFNAQTFQIDQRLAEISTATLVRVVKAPYDDNGNPITPGSPVKIGWIDVQPLVSQQDGYGNATEHGKIFRVKYHRHEGGNGAFITDPVVDDVGKFVVSDRDTSVARRTGKPALPGSRRKFNKADGTYFGVAQSQQAPTQYFSWTADGWSIKDKHNNLFTSTASGITLTDVNGNSIIMSATGIKLLAKAGGIVEATAGGGEHFVLTNGGSGVSTVLKADS
jgi:hypothetical protein